MTLLVSQPKHARVFGPIEPATAGVLERLEAAGGSFPLRFHLRDGDGDLLLNVPARVTILESELAQGTVIVEAVIHLTAQARRTTISEDQAKEEESDRADTFDEGLPEIAKRRRAPKTKHRS